ncbi:MAG TPA: hypothetical protein VMV84_02225 [Dehalococcoidales bacterium]|nr:hypothetical protein [Dehalococcoidales bacterium]
MFESDALSTSRGFLRGTSTCTSTRSCARPSSCTCTCSRSCARPSPSARKGHHLDAGCK